MNSTACGWQGDFLDPDHLAFGSFQVAKRAK